MAPKLDPAKRDEILRLKARGYGYKQIAEMTDCALGTISNVVNDVGGHNEKNDRIDVYSKYHRTKFLELQERFNKWIGDTGKPPKPPKRSKSSKLTALVINDLHVPFHNESALAYAISCNKDADECWVPGDLLDLFSFSRYEKYSAPFSPCEEFQHGRVVIRALAERFAKVRVMHGNHDERFIKWLVRDKQIPPAILEFFQLQDPLFLSPLAKVCAGYSNVEMMTPRTLDFARFGFIHQIGDCVLSHAEKFSKIPNRAVGQVIDWLKSYAEPQGIVKPFTTVIHAHTHQAGATWCNFDVLGIEGGCLARVPDYAGSPKLMGASRPSIVGYTRVIQNNGITDRNEARFVRIQ